MWFIQDSSGALLSFNSVSSFTQSYCTFSTTNEVHFIFTTFAGRAYGPLDLPPILAAIDGELIDMVFDRASGNFLSYNTLGSPLGGEIGECAPAPSPVFLSF